MEESNLFTFFALLIQSIAIVLGMSILGSFVRDRKLILIMIVLGQILSFFSYMILGIFAFIPIIVFYICCIYIRLKKKLTSVLIPLLSLAVFVLTEQISMLIVHSILGDRVNIFGDEIVIIISLLIGGFLGIIMCMLVKFLFRKLQVSNMEKNNKMYAVAIVSFAIVTIAVFYFVILQSRQMDYLTSGLQVAVIVFSLYLLMLLGLFILINRTSRREARLEVEKAHIEGERLQAEQLKEYTTQMELSYEKMRKYRHDSHNMLLGLYELILVGDLEKIESYYSEKIERINRDIELDNYRFGLLKNIQIQEAKGLLVSKIIKAGEYKVNMIVEAIEPIERVNISLLDLNRGLGIILDNAIEEAKECEEPKVQVAFIQSPHSVLIVVVNSCRDDLPPIKKMYKKGFSTKGENRGLGLNSLEELVDNLDNVTLNTSVEKNVFSQQLEVFN